MASDPPRAAQRLRGAALLVATPILLTFAAAPLKLWFLAWIALAPMLVAASEATTVRRAALAGWLTGVLYFAMNLWWLWTASIPGAIAIIVIFACYWGLVAGILRWSRLLNPRPETSPAALAGSVVAAAVVWVAMEWLRCRLFIAFPWLQLGVTQTPLVAMCQVADVGGPWIVSFWVALVNAQAALVWIMPGERRRLWAAGGATCAVLLLTAAYGAWRIASTPSMSGPRVMVVQSNFVTHRGGGMTETPDDLVQF